MTIACSFGISAALTQTGAVPGLCLRYFKEGLMTYDTGGCSMNNNDNTYCTVYSKNDNKNKNHDNSVLACNSNITILFWLMFANFVKLRSETCEEKSVFFPLILDTFFWTEVGMWPLDTEANALAKGLLSAGLHFGRTGVLVTLYMGTALLTNIISNTATCVMMIPVAAHISQQLTEKSENCELNLKLGISWDSDFSWHQVLLALLCSGKMMLQTFGEQL